MATDVAGKSSDGSETCIDLPDSTSVDEGDEEPSALYPSLSVEEYKRKHNIGSRATAENVVSYKESVLLASSPDPLYSAQSSPIKTPDQQKMNDSGIDMEITSFTRTPVVHLGERVTIGNDGQVYNVSSHSRTPSPVKRKYNKKKTEDSVVPGRRVRREASLNASAMVNILFEKDTSQPKVVKKSEEQKQKKSRKSSENTKVSKNKATGKNKEKKKTIKSDLTNLQKAKLKKMTSVTKVAAFKKRKDLKDKLQKMKRKVIKDIKTKKRKPVATGKDSGKQKSKRKKIDTQRAARTDSAFVPKHKHWYSGTQCVSCLQPLSYQHSNMFWSNQKEENKSRHSSDSDDGKSHCVSLDDFNGRYSLPRMQNIDGTPFVNPVVPHRSVPSLQCHQCAQSAGMMSAPCQTYTIGGVGSLGSVNIVPYQTFGATYSVPYQAGPSGLPHCACPSCYPTSMYYAQATTGLSHQPLTHEPCLLPHPVAMPILEDGECKKEEEIIDVGEEEVIAKPLQQQAPLEKKKTKSAADKNKLKTKIKPPLLKTQKSYTGVRNTDVKPGRRRAFSDSSAKVSIKNTVKIKDRVKAKVKEKRKNSVSKSKEKSVIKKSKYERSVSRHGWNLYGEPEKKKIHCQSIGAHIEGDCYPSIKHVDGDIIRVRDCVLLRSGPKKTDIPYVAKVTAFWAHPHDDELMMTLLWYYHPEHTESGRKSQHATCELFASKHKDENSVACIDDKGYVLTYNEYCRYMAERSRLESNLPPRPNVVPNLESEYPRKHLLPMEDTDSQTVFVCRQVYDFKLKRILKNPS